MIKNRLICKYHWIILFFTAFIAFIFFDQAFDMKITMLHSVDLIETLFSKDNFFNFYNYAMDKSLAGEYIRDPGIVCGAIYNILLYLTMGIFALPMLIIKPFVTYHDFSVIINYWGRFVVISISFFCMFLLTKLIKKTGINEEKTELLKYLFLSSPILLYCVIIFNQYDILSVTATVIALFFYYDKKYYKFSFIMSLAVCYKMFALFIFIPLILLKEKRLKNIILYLLCGISVYFITTALCMLFDSGYNRTQEIMMPMFNFYDRIVSSAIPGGHGNISLFILGYAVICFIAYYIKPESKTELPSLLLCFAAYGLLFTFIYFHPQWVLVILPFAVLLVVKAENLKLALIFEILLSFCYISINTMVFLDFSLCSESVFSIVGITYKAELFTLTQNLFRNNIMHTIITSLFPVSVLGLVSAIIYEKTALKRQALPVNDSVTGIRVLLVCRTLILFVYMACPIISLLV